MEDAVHLDNAGGARPTDDLLDSIFRDLKTLTLGNPHSRNPASNLTTDLIDQIRYRILTFLKAPQDDYSVIFTSGATAALKLLAECFTFADSNQNLKGKSDCDPEQERSNFSVTGESDSEEGPCFIYLKDNHTSVTGMREIIKSRKAARIRCIDESVMREKCRTHSKTEDVGKPYSNLFVYPSQSNFCGRKYPAEWTRAVQSGCLGPGNWFVCVDIASHVSTSPVDLGEMAPDFAVMSFYKIFGYPTGLGALIVKNSSSRVLHKHYFGGGTVDVSLPSSDFHRKKDNLSERFEDGTVHFLGIIALKHGFDAIDKKGGMKAIQSDVFQLAAFTYARLNSLTHGNGYPVADILIGSHAFSSPDKQGGILTFNLLKEDGSYVGFTEIDKMAELYGIQLRTGCFCNQGACQVYLGLSDTDVMDNFKNGKVCGDTMDLINGKPVGAVRVSFGWTSCEKDAVAFLGMIYDCFVTDPLISFGDLIGKSNSSVGDPKNRERKVEAEFPPTTRISKTKLTDIYVYPLKSGRPLRVTKWPISETGLKFDRCWMVADRNGLCLTQKRSPKLCSIQPHVSENRTQIWLAAPGMDNLIIESKTEDEAVDDTPDLHHNKICSQRVDTESCGSNAGAWVSKVLNLKDSLLLRQSMANPRISNGESAVSLANVAQYLLINRSSVRRLLPMVQSVRKETDEEELISRFRANIVVETPVPGEEDNWSHINIGAVRFKVTGKCQRCQMVCINQMTGEKEPKILAALRDITQGTMTFGVYLTHVNDGQSTYLDTNDEITVEL